MKRFMLLGILVGSLAVLGLANTSFARDRDWGYSRHSHHHHHYDHHGYSHGGYRYYSPYSYGYSHRPSYGFNYSSPGFSIGIGSGYYYPSYSSGSSGYSYPSYSYGCR